MIKFDNMICVSKRENNKNRSFLFLNKFQAKYIPTDPSKALALFSSIKVDKSDKKTVVIGFAETATAIGAVLCENLGENAFYIHSTREKLENMPKVFFREEHSHAKNHELCLENLDILKSAERFIFVDDEFTTGKTVLNFIEALKENDVISKSCEIEVATLINCMENTRNFEEKGIKYSFIMSEHRDWTKATWEGEIIKDIEISTKDNEIKTHIKNDYLNTRNGVFINEYREKVRNLSEFVFEKVEIPQNSDKILVLGTEEFMYPAIKIGEYLKQKLSCEVLCHATSRSPILPIKNDKYVLKSRAKVTSFYDEDREVFLYNAQKYDKVIIVTDSKNIPKKAVNDLLNALESYGNSDIELVIWRGNEDII